MPPDLSAILALPYLMPAQAQKHVTHNEALRILDVAVQLAVLDRDRTTPPAGPEEGDRHIVAAGAGGAWAGQAGAVAAFLDGGWSFLAPRPGWRAEVLAEGRAVVWDGSAWAEPAAPQQAAMLGINTAADSLSRLAVSAPASLFTHEGGEGGGDHRLKINKAAAGDTASLLFQCGWTGYAEMGLAGGTDFAIKAFDGSDWYEALRIDAAARQVEINGAPVFARGSGPGGEYVRFADGTMICWHRLTMGSVAQNGAGTFDNPYRTAPVDWEFPAAFIAPPAVTATARIQTGFGIRNVCVAFVTDCDSTLARISVFRMSSASDPDSPEAHLTATGRWA